MINLSSDIPEKEKKYFQKYYAMWSKLLVFSDLDKKEIQKFKIIFNEIIHLMEDKKYDEARELMATSIMSLQISKLVKEFGVKYERISK